MVFAPKVQPEVSESDLRPSTTYQTWRQMLESELRDFKRSLGSTFSVVGCPACDAVGTDEFDVFGFTYARCSNCNSLFVSLRPSEAQISEFYNKSEAMRFWLEKIIKPTQNEREAHALEPLAEWINHVIKSRRYEHKLAVVEYAPKFSSLASRLVPDTIANTYLVHDLHVASSLDQKTQRVSDLESVPEKADVILAANVLDRAANPKTFLQQAGNALKPGGLLFVTTNTSSGFEYQILGSASTRLVPPDRMNLLSFEGVQTMVSAAGFKILDISTPGKLDVDIIHQEFIRNPDVALPNFLRYIFTKRDQGVLWSLQDFLQLNNLSSYLRLVAVKL